MPAATVLPKSFTTQCNTEMPALGFGTFQSPPGEVTEAVKSALQIGYRHIDCAALYNNQKEVGKGVRESGVPREQIWITSKLWCDKHHPSRVKPACEETLKELGTTYVDLYLMHWPLAFKPSSSQFGDRDKDNKVILEEGVTLEDTWKAMEALVDAGLAKHIGVSNFSIHNLQRLLKVAQKPIVVNQVEIHPYLPENALIEFCKKQNIVVTAYSPLGSNHDRTPLKDKTVLAIAQQNQLDPGQVLLSWALQRGTVAIPKSTNPQRIKSNFNLKPLSDEDMQKLNDLHKTAAVLRAYDSQKIFGHNVH